MRRRVHKIRLEGNFVRERLEDPAALRRRGFTSFRTKTQGDHRLIFAFDPAVRRRDRELVLQAILHPPSEAAGRWPKFTCRDEVCQRIAGR